MLIGNHLINILISFDIISFELLTISKTVKINILPLTDRVIKELDTQEDKFGGEISYKLPVIVKPKAYS